MTLTESISMPLVFLAYEDLDIGKRALNVFHFIASRAGTKAGGVSTWNFDHLCQPEFKDAAVWQAERSDIVIVARRSGDDFPADIKQWFEQWVRRRQVDSGAMILLFDLSAGLSESIARVRNEMRAHSIAAGMEFFASPLGPVQRAAPDLELEEAAPDFSKEESTTDS